MNSKETMWIPLTQIHGHSLPWHGTDISIKSGGVKLVFFAQKKWCDHADAFHVSKMLTPR